MTYSVQALSLRAPLPPCGSGEERSLWERLVAQFSHIPKDQHGAQERAPTRTRICKHKKRSLNGLRSLQASGALLKPYLAAALALLALRLFFLLRFITRLALRAARRFSVILVGDAITRLL